MHKLAQPINIYDFDHTIYDGDCTVDYYLFCIRHNPLLLKFLPYQFFHFLLYALRIEERATFKSNFFVYLCGINDIERSVSSFWKSHYQNIKDWYIQTNHKRDVIISASPLFLLTPAFDQLHALALIATEVNPTTGSIIGENCRGEEKVSRLKKIYEEPVVESAYSDSLSDLPILRLAQKPYIVRKNKQWPLADYTAMPALKRLILARR